MGESIVAEKAFTILWGLAFSSAKSKAKWPAAKPAHSNPNKRTKATILQKQPKDFVIITAEHK
jgi:hypothetical protein